MTVIDDNPSVVHILTQKLESEMPDAIIVNVSIIESPTDRRTARKGLIAHAPIASDGRKDWARTLQILYREFTA